MEDEKPEPKKVELTGSLKRLILITCLGACHCGFNMWIVSDPSTLKEHIDILSIEDLNKISQNNAIHPALLIFTVSSFLLGCLIGSLIFASLADKCGRRSVLLFNDVFSIISGLTLSVSKSFDVQIVYAFARLFTGFCTGIFSCAVPIYLGEIAPTNLRGGSVTMYIMFVSAGMLIAMVLGGPDILGMPVLLSIPAIMTFFQLFLLLHSPESPRYLLIQKEDTEGARQALQKLRGQDNVDEEIEELRQEDTYERKEKKMTVLHLLQNPSQRWQLVYVMILFTTQQFSGVNAAYFYAGRIFLAMKIQESNVVYSSAVLCFMVLFSHGIAVYKMDTWGRRPMLLSGLGISMISSVLLTMTLELQVTIPWMAYISSILLFIFLSAVVMGPNPVPHLMLTELFLQSSRASAYSIGGFLQWLLILFVGFTFVLVEKHIKTFSFLIFLPFCIISFFYILKCAPETKRKSIVEIRKLLEALLTQKYLNKKQEVKKKKGEKC